MASGSKGRIEGFARWWAGFFKNRKLEANHAMELGAAAGAFIISIFFFLALSVSLGIPVFVIPVISLLVAVLTPRYVRKYILKIQRQMGDLLLKSMFTIGPYEYFSLILGAALSAFVISSFFFLILSVAFNFATLTAFLLALAVTIVSPMVAHHYIMFTVQKRIREVDVNLLDALRHMLSELSAGLPLATAIESIANSDYGMVSELFKESVVLIKGGEDVDEAFRIVSERTKSLQFQRFVATMSYATASGANIEGALRAYIDELGFTQKNEISLYANEAIRLSTFMIIVTGVIPGLLVFMISQGSVISSIRVPVIYILPIYVIAFPLVKYMLTVRLIKASPGV
ncbi:hypothetical protein DRN67_00010 [Candidatus Micrarchaeota archaeon]|nr:MAG: hypothetical protein DRN67_00010 [Candidatus Micrarchaeota archaeon]